MRKHLLRKYPDLFAALIIFICAFAAGRSYFAENWEGAYFYQGQFAPAVSLACGRGFADIDPAPAKELYEFLSLKRDSFECFSLPAVLEIKKSDNWTVFQNASRYLIGSVGLYWRFAGISWSGLAPFMGTLFGAVAALSYGLFRLGMGRITAVIASSLFAMSTSHLPAFIHYRDYSKALFILAGMLVIGALASRPLGKRGLIALAAVFGVLLGAGIGFRMDVLILLPPFMVTLFFFRPGNFMENLAGSSAAAIAFAAALVMSGMPILSSYYGGSNSAHVIMLGLNTLFDTPLNLERSLYEWVNVMGDGYVSHIAHAYLRLVKGSAQLLGYPSREYDMVCAEYLWRVVKNYPADFMARLYAAILYALELPFTQLGALPGHAGGLTGEIYRLRAAVLGPLSGWGLYITGACLSLTSIFNLRLAVFMLLFILYFGGYPVLQFEPRHYFHLEFITLWSLGFLLSAASGAIAKRVRAGRSAREGFIEGDARQRPPAQWRVTRGVTAVAMAAAVILFPLYVARMYQRSHLKDTFVKYLEADKEKLDTWVTAAGGGKVLINGLRYAPEKKEWFINAWYLRADFDLRPCGREEITGAIRYRSRRGTNDYTTSFTIRRGGREVMFFPVFESAVTVFIGMELAEEEAGCLSALYNVKGTRRLPLLPYLTLPDGWEDEPLYISLKKFERPRRPAGIIAR